MVDNKDPVPARQTVIKNINPGKDSNIALIGTVVGKDPEATSIQLDDGTGTITVLISSEDLFEKIPMSAFTRVMGTLLPLGEDFELRAEVIQDMNGLDKELFFKARKNIGME